MNLYTRMRSYFDPELRAKKERAAALAWEANRRKEAAKVEQEAGALAQNPLLIEVRMSLMAWSQSIMPQENMSASACFWFRRGLEQAVKVLDDRLSPSGEE
jgi:hypothetical protein